MTQEPEHGNDRNHHEPDDTASSVDPPQQAADAGEQPPPATQRVGESNVGRQRDDAPEVATPAGDGNYQKAGDREISLSGEDEAQQ